MTTRVGINGFGRIGRQSLKAILERHPDEIEVVAVNDITDTQTNAHLFRYDSTYGRFHGSVEVLDNNDLAIDGKRIRVFAEKEPARIPWGEVGAQVVVESSGFFTDVAKAADHLRDTVKKVVVSAPLTGPADDRAVTIVLGVNEETYDPGKHSVISNASCTTNCLATVAKVIHDNFTIEKALMTTVHSYTNDQRILDVVHKDLRRARAAAGNVIPTSTGAARALYLVIPALKGKFDGFSLRVPTMTVSVVDLVATVAKPASKVEINRALREAGEGRLHGILDYTEEPLVSSDFRGDPHSAIVDGLSTMDLGGNFIKVIAWYDNEWGYSCRVSDVVTYVAERL